MRRGETGRVVRRGTIRTAAAVMPSIVIAVICAVAFPASPSPAGPLQHPELIHDPMTYGEHPEFQWHSNLVGWLSYLDGYLTGLPDLGWRSGVISDIRFDVRSDTTMLITRIDRNEWSRFVIGYTPEPYWMNWYSYEFIKLGAMIGNDGSIRPVWAIGDPTWEPGFLEPGIYDLRMTVDRVSGTFIIEADSVGSYDAPLSTFSNPEWSAAWTRDLDDFLYIQICPYNESSAVYDVWSTLSNPALLRIVSMPEIVVPRGDTVSVRTAAEYDGEDPLIWSISDDRFSRAADAFVWETGPGDCGLYDASLSVTDGFLIDTVTVTYAVTHVYEAPALHDRMNGFLPETFEWSCFGKALWFTGTDGYLGSLEPLAWSSSAVAGLREEIDATRSWVFRVAAGGGNEYALGLTTTPPAEHSGYVNSIRLGATLYGDGTIFPSFGTGCTPADGTVLPEGIHDIRVTWDPSAGQARFEAAPVCSWVDSISGFPGGAVWTACASAPLSPPAWLQVNLHGPDARVYDVWSMPVSCGPSSLLSAYCASGRAAGVYLEWSFASPPEGEGCVVLRCTGVPGDCETIARIPIARGATSFHWLDEEPRPGSTFTYRVYLDTGGLELLFDSGPVTVPRAAAALFQNHPNPFNPSTVIEWYLPEAAPARVCIFDVSGRIVRTLFNGRCPAGKSSVVWDGRDDAGAEAAAGVYLCRFVSGEFEQGRKMVLLR